MLHDEYIWLFAVLALLNGMQTTNANEIERKPQNQEYTVESALRPRL